MGKKVKVTQKRVQGKNWNFWRTRDREIRRNFLSQCLLSPIQYSNCYVGSIFQCLRESAPGAGNRNISGNRSFISKDLVWRVNIMHPKYLNVLPCHLILSPLRIIYKSPPFFVKLETSCFNLWWVSTLQVPFVTWCI